MGEKMVKMYYREADVFVIGKYGNEVPLDLAVATRDGLLQRYGEYLKRVNITYDKRKTGIVVTAEWHKEPDYHSKKREGDEYYNVEYIKKGEGVYKNYKMFADGTLKEEIRVKNIPVDERSDFHDGNDENED